MRDHVREQIATVVTRAKYGAITTEYATAEIADIQEGPDIAEADMSFYLHTISEQHQAGTIPTQPTGTRWAGLPSGKGVQKTLKIQRGRIRHVRDAWYRLVAGMSPFDADSPREVGFDIELAEVRQLEEPSP